MKKILAIAIKDARIRFSGVGELVFFIVLPLVFTFILGGGFGTGAGEDQADGRVRIPVVDEAHSPLSQELITQLEASDTLLIEVLERDEAEQQFEADGLAALLIIPAGFELSPGQADVELRQAPNNLNATVAERSVRAVLSKVGSAYTIAQNSVAEAERLQPFADEAARKTYFDASLAAAQTALAGAPDRVTTTQAATPEGFNYDPAAQASAGQLITWVFIPLLGISGLYAYERQQGTLRRLLTTPTQKATFLLGTIGGQLATALVQMAFLVLFGIGVMGLSWGPSPAALALILFTFGLAAAAFGTMLGTFVKSEGQATGLSVMLGMVMALLGGCWYPIELFPQAVRTAVNLLPTTWAMQAMLDMVLRGQGLAAVWPEAGVLLGFAAVFFTIGVWRFRFEA